MHKSTFMAILLMACSGTLYADGHKIILEGSSPQKEYELSKYNRIYFDDNGLRLASHTNSLTQAISWNYTNYNVVKFDLLQSGLNETSITVGSLNYSDGKLTLTSETPESYSCEVYNIAGMTIAAGMFAGDCTYSVESLPSGLYFAVATNGQSRITLKFIKK